MTDKKYKYWLAVVDGQTVQFSDLAHLMAIAMHPEGGMDYAAARINLDDELKLAVRDGLLRVRNPAGLGFHTFPHGNALQRAVLMPNTDLEPFLNERGIELRITPYGNGPEYWTLENAAAAMQEQLNWHDGTRAEFQDQMQEAAASGALVILGPRTCLPIRSERVRTYWEYVTPDTVNEWLTALKAPYRWNPATPLVTVPHKSPRDFKPWETLVPFFKPINGLYMYQQAAREIADAEGWDDSKLEALEAEMISAVNNGSLPIRSRKTGMVIAPDSLDALALVMVDDVNEWLERNRVPYRWKLQSEINQDADDVPTVDMQGAQRYKNENVTRNATGRYSILEAMEVLYATHGESVRTSIELHIGNALNTGLLVVLDSVDGLPVHGRRAPQPFGDIVTPAAIDAWLEADGFAPHIRWPSAGTVTTGAKVPNVVPALVESAMSGLQPVPTSAMAASFSGLRWDGKGWLKTLGNKPRWLDTCLALGAARGEGMRRWNPVLIGAYLVNMGHAKANSVRAKFQSQDALKPWLDEWKTYEADNFPAD